MLEVSLISLLEHFYNKMQCSYKSVVCSICCAHTQPYFQTMWCLWAEEEVPTLNGLTNTNQQILYTVALSIIKKS